MRKVKIYALLVAIALMLALPMVAIASDVSGAAWRGVVRITNSGNSTETIVSTNMTLGVQGLIDNGYADNETDFSMQYSGSDIAFMPGYNTNPWVMYISSIGSGLNVDYDLYSGNVTGGIFRYFPDASGMTISDNDTMEPGDNYTSSLIAWIDTTALHSLLMQKLGAWGAYITATGNITAVVDGSDVDVGAAATDRGAGSGSNFTYIGVDNSANQTGIITSIEVWALTTISDLRVGTFDLVSGDIYRCRDSQLVGNVTSGAKRTIDGLSLSVETGDYIGFYSTDGAVEVDAAGFGGRYYVAGEYIDPGDQTTYTLAAASASSLYGIGSSVFVTAENIDSGELTVSPTANVTDLALYIGGDLKDSTAITANITNSSDDWVIGSLATPYIESFQHTVNSTLVADISWQYGTTFTDGSGYGNDATPTFRTDSSSANVSASLLSFAPTSTSEITTYSLTDSYAILFGNVTAPSGMFDELNFTALPAAPINVMLSDAGVPQAAWWFPLLFLGIGIIGLLTYGATTMTRSQRGRLSEGQIDGSLLTQFIVMEFLLVILGFMGPIPLWPSYLFPIAGLALILSRKHFSWG